LRFEAAADIARHGAAAACLASALDERKLRRHVIHAWRSTDQKIFQARMRRALPTFP
jgi:hypothetical protein